MESIPDLEVTLPQRGLPLPPGAATLSLRAVSSLRANVTRGDVVYPAMVLKQPALASNLEVMRRYSEEHGYLLAPHGKTTMAPQLFRAQLDHGAWGITVASVAQAEVARRAGAQRVLIANEVTGRADISQLAAWLSAGSPTVFCLVDSVAGAGRLERGLRQAGAAGRLPVLIEVGWPGGRTGVRTEDQLQEVAAAIGTTGRLRLAGVEGYEGVVGTDRAPATLARVDSYLELLRRATLGLARRRAFEPDRPVLVSAGGSKYFDRVAEVLAAREWPLPVEVVVRSGCYLTHDHGHYAEVSPLAQAGAGGRLVAALEVWAEVLSVPEPGRAIVGMGRRDVSFDAGLPVPLQLARQGGELTPAPPGMAVTGLDDQHGYLTAGDTALEPGDLAGFGLSHPCTAFDKWRLIPLVDDDYTIIDVIRTCF